MKDAIAGKERRSGVAATGLGPQGGGGLGPRHEHGEAIVQPGLRRSAGAPTSASDAAATADVFAPGESRQSRPSVSVALAAFNGERHLREQLDSIVRQTYPVDQLVIVDDASTDSTPTILRDFERQAQVVCVVVLRHNGNRGVRASFEEAISTTVGDVVFLADQDDVWLPEKVERCVQTWTAGDAHVFMHDVEICDSMLTRTGARSFSRNPRSPYSPKWSFQGMAMFGTGAFVRACVPFGTGHDTFIGLIGRLTGRLETVREPLALYRRHDGNVSSRDSRFGVSGRGVRTRLRLTFRDRWMHRSGSLDGYLYKSQRALDALLRLQQEDELFSSQEEKARLAAAIDGARVTRRIAKRRRWVARGSFTNRLPRALAVARRTRPGPALVLRYVRDALVAEGFRSA